MRTLLAFLVSAPLWATTYYVRSDGTVLAASKASATSCSVAGTALSIAQASLATFAGDDVIDGCSNAYRATLTVPSSGTAGHPITVQSFTIKGSDVITGWAETANLGNCNTTTQHCWSVSYAHTISASVGYTWKDGTKLSWQAGTCPNALADHEYCWSGNVLYVRNDAGNLDSLAALMEVTNRNNAIFLNTRSYITIRNVSVAQTESYAIRHATSSVGVTWDNVKASQVYTTGQFSNPTGAVINNSSITGYLNGLLVDSTGAGAVTVNNTTCTGEAYCYANTNSNAATVYTINNSLADGYQNPPYYVSGAATTVLSNSISPGSSFGTADIPVKATAGAISVDYSILLPDGQNGTKTPVSATRVTEGSHNLYTVPMWTSPAKRGVVSFMTDDYPDLCDWRKLNDLSSQYGIYTTLSLSQTYLLNSSAAAYYYTTATGLTQNSCYGSPYLASIASGSGSTTDQAILQGEINKGHDIVAHTRSHPSLSTVVSGACAGTLCAMDVQYAGNGTAATLSVSATCPGSPCALTTTVTGASDGSPNLNYDLTGATYWQIQAVCNAIQATGKYTCTQPTASHESYSYRVPAVFLAAVSGQDIKTAVYALNWNGTAYYAHEMNGAMSDINAALNCNSAPVSGACAGGPGAYNVKVLNYPDGNVGAGTIAAMISAGYQSGRTTTMLPWLSPLNMYQIPTSPVVVGAYVLAFENNANDSTSNVANFTATNLTYSATQFYRGASSAVFNGTSGYVSKAAGAAYSDFHRGDFVLGYQLYPSALTGDHTLYFERSDDTNYHWLYVSAAGAVVYSIVAAGVETLRLATADGVISTGSGTGATAIWRTVELNAHGGLYRLFISGVVAASIVSAARPAVYTDSVYIGASNFAGVPGNYYAGYMDDAVSGMEPYSRVIAQLNTLAANGGFTTYTMHGEGDAPRAVVRSMFEAARDYTATHATVKVMTQSAATAYLLSVGTLGSDGATLTWAQTAAPDYHPRMGSWLCGRGTTPGLTTDRDGRPWVTNDIGPYRCVPKTAFGGVM